MIEIRVYNWWHHTTCLVARHTTTDQYETFPWCTCHRDCTHNPPHPHRTAPHLYQDLHTNS